MTYSKCRVPRLSDMPQAKDIRIYVLQTLTELVSWWGMQVRRQWLTVAYRARQQGEEGCDLVAGDFCVVDYAPKVVEPVRRGMLREGGVGIAKFVVIRVGWRVSEAGLRECLSCIA